METYFALSDFELGDFVIGCVWRKVELVLVRFIPLELSEEDVSGGAHILLHC